MDDEFLVLLESSEIMSWLEEIESPHLQPIRETAFERYTMRLPLQRHACHSNSNPNANKRMIEFLRKNRIIETTTTQQERKRSIKHMMMERMRRKKHRQIYLALHHLLPQGTKSDTNSILETAVKEVEELRRRDGELRRRNEEIMEMIYNYAAFENENCIEKAKLDLKVENPASGVDSMLEVLRCLKNAGCLTTSIQSTFFHHHFAATLHFQTTCWMRMRAEEVEKAVQTSLFDAEMNFRHGH